MRPTECSPLKLRLRRPFIAAFFLTSTTGQTGWGAFVAPVNAPNGFTVTFDAMLTGGTNPPADGIICFVHGQAAPLPSASWPVVGKCVSAAREWEK